VAPAALAAFSRVGRAEDGARGAEHAAEAEREALAEEASRGRA
jgi:hypothetical protein